MGAAIVDISYLISIISDSYMCMAIMFLCAAFLLLLGTGVLPRNFALELLLLLVFGGWCVFWLVSLLCEKAGGRHYLRLCHWALFLVLFGLVLGGMLG